MKKCQQNKKNTWEICGKWHIYILYQPCYSHFIKNQRESTLESTDPEYRSPRKRNSRPSSTNHCPQAALLLIITLKQHLVSYRIVRPPPTFHIHLFTSVCGGFILHPTIGRWRCSLRADKVTYFFSKNRSLCQLKADLSVFRSSCQHVNTLTEVAS